MVPSVRIPIDDASKTAEARRVGLRMATDIGLDENRAGQIAIVITEACTNLIKHARGGEILLHISENPGSSHPQLEVLSLDRGPGIYDIELCIADGFTTSSSPGNGLGAIRRLAGASDFYSEPGSGTAILARWPATGSPAPARMHAGAVNISREGEEVCGDAWVIEEHEGLYTVMVADGLGHGYEANQASREAVRILRNHRDVPPGRLIDLVHKALRSLRGAAVAIARVDPAAGQVSFSGLGNVTAQVYSGYTRFQHLVSANGTAGHAAGKIREFTYPWPANGLLMMHSDGLSTQTALDTRPALVQRDPSLIAGVLYRDFARGHDDATVVIAKVA